MNECSVTNLFKSARTDHRLHLTSFDPCCHDPGTLADTIRTAVEAKTDGFLLGGSTGVDRKMVDTFAGIMRDTLIDLFGDEQRPPVVLFPSSSQTGVSTKADAVLFLSLLNSRDVRFLIREQAMAAPFLKPLGLEPIGCGMIVVAPGGTVGRVGQADLIAPEDVSTAVGYAAAASAFGFSFLYLNAGSGSDRPVPVPMIQAVAQAIDVPLIVGGGLTDAKKVAAATQAGADIVVTGTAIESGGDIGSVVASLAQAVHAVPALGAM